MNQQTNVNEVKLRSRTALCVEETRKYTVLPERKKSFGQYFLRFDQLVRNLAVVGGLVLVIVAVKNSSLPEAKSVFGTLQENASMHWDESVGKLSFVNNLLPETIREVWNESPSLLVAAPVDGNVVHAWSTNEPYMLLQGKSGDIRASATGEVMSIAHGIQEERIIRLRHADGTETIYGNLQECYVETGTTVTAGELIGKVTEGQPLAFETRVDGRSVDPSKYLDLFDE